MNIIKHLRRGNNGRNIIYVYNNDYYISCEYCTNKTILLFDIFVYSLLVVTRRRDKSAL